MWARRFYLECSSYSLRASICLASLCCLSVPLDFCCQKDQVWFRAELDPTVSSFLIARKYYDNIIWTYSDCCSCLTLPKGALGTDLGFCSVIFCLNSDTRPGVTSIVGFSIFIILLCWSANYNNIKLINWN
jgi:hypothetical protein